MRLIDADDFANRMYHEAFEKDTDMQRWDSGCWIRYKLFENVLREQPTAQPERKRGHWTGVMYDDGTPPRDEECWCSRCGNYAPLMPNDRPANFCPICGADMREVGNVYDR